MKQSSLVKDDMVKKDLVLFKSYCCKNCGSADVDVFKSTNSICLKCSDCNERVIFRTDDRKQGALEELEKLRKIIHLKINSFDRQEIDDEELEEIDEGIRFGFVGAEDLIVKRIKELEGEGVEK